MNEIQQGVATVDPETICTRVVSRVIEQLGRLEIAPDSPQWEPLRGPVGEVGELRRYRGRRGVEQVVCAHLSPAGAGLDSHMVAVFTDPQSPAPHFLVDAVVAGRRASFHVELLPKVDLAASPAYLAHCFAPLESVKARMERDTRLEAGELPRAQQALLTPWTALYRVAPLGLGLAMEYIQAYFEHWSGLITRPWPAAALAEVDGQAAARRSARLRAALFNRAVDPMWAALDQTLGGPVVDRLLEALVG